MKDKEKFAHKAKAVFETITYCISLSWKSSKLYTCIRLGGKAFVPFVNIGSAVIGKYILDLLSGELEVSERSSALMIFVLALIALNIVGIVVQRIQDYAMSMHNDLLEKVISTKMMERGSQVDMEYYDNPEYNDLFVLARQNMQSVIGVMWNSMDCVSYFISFVGTFSILCRANVLYAIVIIFVSIPSAVASRKYVKNLYKANVEQVNDQRKLNHLYSISASREYAEDVRLFNIGGYIRSKYLVLWEALFRYRKRVIRRGAILVGTLDLMPQILTFFILMDITSQILGGMGTVGDYSMYYGILNQLMGSIYVISSSVMRIYDDKLRIENVKKFDAIKNKIKNAGTRVLSDVQTVEFRDVCFTYPGTDKRVLDHVSFVIGQGEKVALVGVNGAGKTTIIKLLLRFYDVDEGGVFVNGKDIREYELDGFRKAFSTHFQKCSIYGFSLRENITISDRDAYHGEDGPVLKALEEGDAVGILSKLPGGLDTCLTRSFEEDGVELSMGQYQKIALTRTFFRSSSVILLDEPSSSLDPEAEFKVFESLIKLCKDKTTLFTSHRLSNIFIADKIVVIEDGKIIEQGTHRELLENSRRYAELFKYQADKFNMG